MNEFKLNQHPHRRFNPLIGEWILVSPHRTRRPWQGAEESGQRENKPKYDPGCYLCPGNERAGGIINPKYESTFVFTNDFAALLPDTPDKMPDESQLFQVLSVKGTSRVICFSPRHDLTLPEMKDEEILKVVNLWVDQYAELAKDYLWVQIFENKGDIMGCSNPHPHGQIWAGNQLPNVAVAEDRNQAKYHAKNGSVLLLDYVRSEMVKDERVIAENEHWVVLVPFWAVWPFETLLLPKRHIKLLDELSADEKITLAEILKLHLTKYDNIFNVSFPYSMGWHNAPNNNMQNDHWLLHAHFYPPLLRSASVRKFMVGYEMLAEAQRDITPEQAANKLKEVSSIHYKEA